MSAKITSITSVSKTDVHFPWGIKLETQRLPHDVWNNNNNHRRRRRKEMLINTQKNSQTSSLLRVFVYSPGEENYGTLGEKQRKTSHMNRIHACMRWRWVWRLVSESEDALTGILFLRRQGKLAVNLLFPANNCRLLFAILSFLLALNYAWERRAPPPSGSQTTRHLQNRCATHLRP